MNEPATNHPTTAGRIPDRLADLLDLDPVDRRDTEALLQTVGSSADVAGATATLRSRLGTFPPRPVRDDSAAQRWICAIVLFAEQTASWHRDQGIDQSITAATLADVGRQLRLHRQTHGVFGLETWWFLTMHLAGSLFQLGRLQFVLRQSVGDVRTPPGTAGWVLDVHIPPTGPLTPELVDASFQQAVSFFREHFPDRPAGTAVCSSWLLDPYLVEQLPSSNISHFQQLFTRYTDGVPAQDDVVYFVFRTRNTDLADLPRDTRLQRAVLDRITAGGTWRSYRGFRTLDAAAR